MSSTFESVFGGAPQAVGKAPGRVNLLGEHTDYNEGFVLPLALAQQATVSLGQRSSGPCTVHSAELAETVSFDLASRPDAPFARYVYGCLIEARADGRVLPPALDIHIASDVPIGAGLSSSAALEVATLRALDRLLGRESEPVELALRAQRAEIRHAGVNCGVMDQMASSLGDESHAVFIDTRSLAIRRVPLPTGTAVLVLDSGVPRALAASGYNQRRRECAEACDLLGVGSLRDAGDEAVVESLPEPWRRRARHVVSENARVVRAAATREAAEFGALMNESHASLRDDYEVSVPRLDELVALLQAQPGVWGARLTGAGFGGACIALCVAERAEAVSADALEAFASRGGRGSRLALCRG